jgi:hypothetical protein
MSLHGQALPATSQVPKRKMKHFDARKQTSVAGSNGSRPGIAGIGRHGIPRGSGPSSMTRSFRSTRICIRIDPEVTQRGRSLDA